MMIPQVELVFIYVTPPTSTKDSSYYQAESIASSCVLPRQLTHSSVGAFITPLCSYLFT